MNDASPKRIRCAGCQAWFDPEIDGAMCNSCSCALCQHCMGIECERCCSNADRGIFETKTTGIVVCSQCVRHCLRCQQVGEMSLLCPHCIPRHEAECPQKTPQERALAAVTLELETKELQLLEARDEMSLLQHRIQKLQGEIDRARKKKEKAARDVERDAKLQQKSKSHGR